jgi:alcohol dehydrogenase class IV
MAKGIGRMSELATLAPFEFISPGRVVFGWGRRQEIGTLAAALGRRALLVCGSRHLRQQGVVAELRDRLGAAGVELIELADAEREPTIADVDQAVARAKSLPVQAGDVVLALGGGAALDLAKAVAGLAPQPSVASIRDYLEGIGTGCTMQVPPLPLLAMPTTAGTGSEATKNAVISCNDPPCKKSFRDPRLVPQAVLIDPELTAGLPRDVTRHSGLDCITQLVESYLTRKANPLTQALALDGFCRAMPALRALESDPTSRPAREAMAYAAYLSGLTLANSGLGMAHGVAAALGAHLGVSHGLACAIMLPAAVRFNRSVRQHELAQLGNALARTMGIENLPDENPAAEFCCGEIERLVSDLEVPSHLAVLGVTPNLLDALVEGSRGNSLSGNPREVRPSDLHRLLSEML